MSSRVKITWATHALFFETPTSNNHNNNNKLSNFFKKNVFCARKMWIITYLKFNTIHLFFLKKNIPENRREKRRELPDYYLKQLTKITVVGPALHRCKRQHWSNNNNRLLAPGIGTILCRIITSGNWHLGSCFDKNQAPGKRFSIIYRFEMILSILFHEGKNIIFINKNWNFRKIILSIMFFVTVFSYKIFENDWIVINYKFFFWGKYSLQLHYFHFWK